MRLLSLFQLLPLHVLELVVGYVGDDSNLDPDGTTRYTMECKEHHMPLLWVCRNLRDVVYSRYTRNYILSLTNVAYKTGLHDVDRRCPWILCHEYNRYSTRHSAKRVVIEADLQCICSGMALKVLSCAPYDNCVFSMARTLAFAFITDDGLKIPTIDPSAAMANISAFVKRLHQMAPKACELRMLYQNPGDRANSAIHHMGNLIKDLLQTTNRFMYSLGHIKQSVRLDFSGVCHLVHIDCERGLNDVHIVPLARQCAQTLQFLKVHVSVGSVSEYSEISGLICDNDGGYVQYPSLFGSYPSIQVLDLVWTGFTLSDVVTLIKSLPLLSVLKTRYPSLDLMPDGVTKAGFAKYMLDTHGGNDDSDDSDDSDDGN
ncbi:hypothetical protein GGI09_000656 [Coemansia sp. S100]|nr:hypothetical protein GGI09_000656 [Coemansia sp. S100]